MTPSRFHDWRYFPRDHTDGDASYSNILKHGFQCYHCGSIMFKTNDEYPNGRDEKIRGFIDCSEQLLINMHSS